MPRMYDDPERPESPIRPEAALAAEVVRLALVDALGAEPELAADARAFLAGPELRFWSLVGGLDPEAVKRLAERVLSEGPGPGRWVGQPRLLKRA